MANTTISPNMGLPVPTVSVDPGPDWAQNINSCLSVIDAHNHSPGSGVQITPSGLNINSDLTFNSNNAIALRSMRFTAQSAPLALPADVGILYESGVDLYYNDGSGNQVRITQSGSVTGSSGTITGLPSGTASASYSGGTFTFQKATNTPAHMIFGGIVINQEIVGGFGVTVQTSASQASNYSLTLPIALPSVTSYLQSDNAGNLSFATVGYTPLGGVIPTFPNLAGAYTTAATTVADANGFVLCNGQTISDVTSPMNGAVIPNLNSAVFLQGNSIAGGTGGASTSSGVGAHTHAFTSSGSFAGGNHTHNFAHTHIWGSVNSGQSVYTLYASNTGSNSIGTGGLIAFQNNSASYASGSAISAYAGGSGSSGSPTYWTSGVAANGGGSGTGNAAITSVETPAPSTVSGTTNSTGSSFSIVPPFVNCVYIMRIK